LKKLKGFHMHTKWGLHVEMPPYQPCSNYRVKFQLGHYGWVVTQAQGTYNYKNMGTKTWFHGNRRWGTQDVTIVVGLCSLFWFQLQWIG
jgi:hypothetical protein